MCREIATIERNYRHAMVRDLAWAIASPPLLQPEHSACEWFDAHWYLERYREAGEWLAALDRDPAALIERVAAQNDQRLGRYFETLWAFWLETGPRFELIEKNLPVREGGDTLGELDFITRDRHTGLNYHWEVAVKFYLGVGDTCRQQNWHGPGGRDRLDIKLSHLQHRQSVLCRLPQTRVELKRRGIKIAGCAVILKGRLYYPSTQSGHGNSPLDANPGHLRSRWYRLADFINAAGREGRFQPLLGAGWMARPDELAPAGYDLRGLLEALESGQYRLPLQLMRLDGERPQRVFVVPDDWDRPFLNGGET